MATWSQENAVKELREAIDSTVETIITNEQRWVDGDPNYTPRETCWASVSRPKGRQRKTWEYAVDRVLGAEVQSDLIVQQSKSHDGWDWYISLHINVKDAIKMDPARAALAEWINANPEIVREVQQAEAEVNAMHKVSDLTAQMRAAYDTVRDLIRPTIDRAWEWTREAEDKATRIQRRDRTVAMVRDLTNLNMGITDEDLRYVRDTLRYVGPAYEITGAVDEWTRIRREKEYAANRAERYSDEPDTKWDCENIPGWNAPVGTKEWLDGTTELLARIKARA